MMYMIDNTDMYIFHVARHPRQTEPTPIDTIIDFVLIKQKAYTFSKSDPGFFDRGVQKCLRRFDFFQINVSTLSVWTVMSKQTVKIKIRHRRTRRLIRVYTVCHSSNNFRHIYR